VTEAIERQAGFLVDGARAREALPPLDDQVGIVGVDLDAVALTANLLGCNQRAPGTQKRIQDKFAASSAIHPTATLIFIATFLIVLGLAFEAVEIGWARLLPHGLWLFSVIVPGLWNMLALQWNDPVWRGLVKIAPLSLVAIGMMILLVQKRVFTQERSTRARSGGKLDE